MVYFDFEIFGSVCLLGLFLGCLWVGMPRADDFL